MAENGDVNMEDAPPTSELNLLHVAADNGKNMANAGIDAVSSTPASAPMATVLPPIGHLLFTLELLNDSHFMASDSQFPLHPPMVIPPSIMSLMQHFMGAANGNNTSGGATQTPALPSLSAPSPSTEQIVSDAFSAFEAAVAESLNNPMQNLAKKYKGPRPDRDTFPTQAQFLKSLEPVDISSVEESNRKCAICWKRYGEAPDPGFDNSELPVKLRCSHVFGNKCLNSIFAERPDTKVELTPLSFDDAKSRGSELIRILETLFGNAPESTHEQIIIDILERVINPRKGRELFGKYWWAVFEEVKRTRKDVSDVVLMENAVFLNIGPIKKRKESTEASSSPPVSAPASAPTATASTASTPPSLISSHLSTSGSVPVSADTPALAEPALPQWLPESPMPPDLASSGPFQNGANTNSTTANTLGQAGAHSVLGTIPQLSQEEIMHYEIDPVDLEFLDWAPPLAAGPLETQPTTDVPFETILSHLPANSLQQWGAYVAETQSMLAPNVNSEEYTTYLKLKAQQFAYFDTQKRRTIAALARRLRKLYRSYLAEKPVSQDAKEESTIPENDEPDICTAAVEMHKDNSKWASLMIQHPDTGHAGFNSESDDGNDDDEMIDYTRKTFVISRKSCNNCYKSKKEMKGWVAPKSIFWRNDDKMPDDCPLCHKVLFNKDQTGSPFNFPTVNMGGWSL